MYGSSKSMKPMAMGKKAAKMSSAKKVTKKKAK